MKELMVKYKKIDTVNDLEYNYNLEEFTQINNQLKFLFRQISNKLKMQYYNGDKEYKNEIYQDIETARILIHNQKAYKCRLSSHPRRAWEWYSEFLSEELYDFLLTYSKIPFSERINLNTMMEIWEYVFEHLTHDALRQLLAKEPSKHIVEIEERIYQFYYLSVFYGNPIGNQISISNNINGGYPNGLMSHKKIYNCMEGFEGNLKCLTIDIYERIKEHVQLSDSEIENVLKGTQIKDHNILETALYLKEIMATMCIFAGMELTPIIVNLCKTVEILEADLIDKLNEQYDFNRYNFKIGYFDKERKRFVGEEFDKEKRWKDDNSIFILQTFINNLNTTFFKTKDKYEKVCIKKGEKKQKNDNEKNLTYTKILENRMDIWRKEVRNGNLHKHDTMDYKKVNEIFDKTMELIALLIEWYNIVSKE